MNNTNNPVGSTDLLDFEDNRESFDRVLTEPASATILNRRGAPLVPWAKVSADMSQAVAAVGDLDTRIGFVEKPQRPEVLTTYVDFRESVPTQEDTIVDKQLNVYDVVGNVLFTPEGVRPTLATAGSGIQAREAMFRMGRAVLLTFKVHSYVRNAVLCDQYKANEAGRLQIYANRSAATTNAVGFLHVNIYGSSVPLPPVPIRYGYQHDLIVDITAGGVVTVYLDGEPKGSTEITLINTKVNTSFLGGGLVASKPEVTLTRVASVASENLDELFKVMENVSSVPLFLSTSVYAISGGKEVANKNIDKIGAPASLTKMLNVITALTHGAVLTDTVTVEAGDATGGSGNNLKTGDIITVENLIINMMLPSSNVAASVMARHIGGTVENYMLLMNSKAQEIGMGSSIFKNPHGLSATGVQTTARDLMKLLKASATYPVMRAIWGRPTASFEVTGLAPRTINVTSSITIAEDPAYIGGKTGTVTGSEYGDAYNLAIHARSTNGAEFFGIVLHGDSDVTRYADLEKAMSLEGGVEVHVFKDEGASERESITQKLFTDTIQELRDRIALLEQ